MKKLHIAAAILLAIGVMDVDASTAPMSSASKGVQLNSGFAGKANGGLSDLLADARDGDAEAQYRVGMRYRTGEGVSPDEYQAFQWCLSAAREGHSAAQYQVGMMYLNGEGVTASDATALDWFEKSASAGNTQAQDILDYVLNNDFTIGC
jgi:TPR repeat protein